MPSLDEVQSPRDRAVGRIAQEIAIAERDRVPTSRQRLSQLIVAEFKLPPADAADLVDEYCDENAPGVPYYLKEEFENPFLKVMAIFNSILGIAVIWYGSTLWHKGGKTTWPWFVFGAILVACAGYCWFKTVQQELEKRARAGAS
jgi:hypothetical protein